VRRGHLRLKSVSSAGVGVGLRWEFLDDVLALVDSGEAAETSGIDFFEVSPENYMRRGGYFPEALERVRERFPVLTHGLTMSLGGLDPLGDDYMGELKRFVDRLEPAFHSDHLCFCGAGGRMVHDLLPLPLTRAAAAHAASRVREASDRLERPLAVENISYYFVPGQAQMRDQDFVAEVVEAADAPLLFDVNNLYVNAENHGFDTIEYLDRIPFERIVELHVAGHEIKEEEGLVIDTHAAPVVAPVLALLERVVERTGPLPVLLERDNRVPSWSEMLREAALVRAAYDRGIARWDAAPLRRGGAT
jgi:uncharacterized protein